MRYLIVDREGWNTLEEASSIEKAKEILEKFEDRDKKESTYTPDFYQIIDENGDVHNE